MRDPRAFLMDEPLSNLDAKLRVQMRTEVARIQQLVGTTTVYVTHDQTEAMTLGDRVAVMRAGMIQQVASPKVLYEDPANLFVAGYIGSPAMNFLPAKIEGGSVKLPFGDAPRAGGLEGAVDEPRELIAGMRPSTSRTPSVAAERGIQGMKFKAKVEVVESMGSELYAYFDVKAAAHSGEAGRPRGGRGAVRAARPGRRVHARRGTPRREQQRRRRQGDRARARHQRHQAVRPQRPEEPHRRRGRARPEAQASMRRPASGRPLRPGGSAARSLSSIRARSPTPTVTASATCASSWRGSTT